MLKMILCVDKDFGIAKDDKLAWNIKEEMNHFKNTTMNHIVVMGYKTFESMNNRLLPNRTNIILSRKKNLEVSNAIVTNDVKYIINLAETQDVFIIGGKQIYELFNEHCDEIILSQLKKSYNCDLFYKPNLENFKLSKKEEKDDFTIFHYKK